MRPLLLTAVLAVLLSACHSSNTRPAAPTDSPLLFATGEQQLLLQQTRFWSGIEMFGADAGFGYTEITPTEDGNFRIYTESIIRMQLLQNAKELIYRSTEVVSPELLLLSFDHYQNSDGYEQQTSGYIEDDHLYLTVRNAAGDYPQDYALSEPLFSHSASLIYPALHGLRNGARYSYLVYDNESRQPGLLQQTVHGPEATPLAGNKLTWRIESLFNGIESTAWLDTQVNPIMEKTLNGNIVITAMTEQQATEVLARASINKSENLVGFSMVHTAPIPQARNLKSLDIVIVNLPQSFVPPEVDGRQSCIHTGDNMRCNINAAKSHDGSSPMAADTAATTTINSDHPRIMELALNIAGKQHPDTQIDALLQWIGNNIESKVVDAFTALDVLDSGQGECQGQTFLYTSMARALDIPTRVVNGLVYSEEHNGFLYHTWAESWDGKNWRSVDPTFRQSVADASHIRLITGAEADDLAPLANIIGRINASIISYN